MRSGWCMLLYIKSWRKKTRGCVYVVLKEHCVYTTKTFPTKENKELTVDAEPSITWSFISQLSLFGGLIVLASGVLSGAGCVLPTGSGVAVSMCERSIRGPEDLRGL